MRYILFLFILLFTLKGFSISRIEGRINGYYNERIELLKNRDHLSKLKALLDADTITSSGYFSFSIDNQSSFTGYLRIADRVLPIHIQPNATIFLQLKCPQNLEDLLTPIAFDSVGVSNVKFDEWKCKNAFLANFNQFLEKNQTRIFYHKADSVKKQFVDSIYTSNPLLFEQSEYINNFVNFTLAGLEIVLGTPDQVIFDSLIQSSQLLYTSDAYSTFVLQFFNERTNQLFNSAYRSKQSQLQQSPFEVINTIFGQDSLISKNERLKEYLILGFALDHVKTSMVPTETWLRLMYQIAQNSAYEEHRLIAQNVIQKLDILEQKELAPPFQLPQENGKKYDLKDANGKFVYIQFWADWSMESTRHMKVLERIHKENGRNVQVISININRDVSKMINTLEANRSFKWPFLHFDLDYGLLREYAVTTAPLYYLLDPNGRVLMAPADDPVKMFDLLTELRTSSSNEKAPYLLINDYEKERLR